MRIYLTEPHLFAKHAGKFVTLVPESPGHFGMHSVIRTETGDYKRIKTDSLDVEFEDSDVIEELHNNIRLREVALEDNLIEVGDYHNDDNNYLNYISSY